MFGRHPRRGAAVSALTADAARPRLGWPTKALYGAGAVGTSVKMQLMGLALLFYNQLVGLDAAAVSLALFIALFIDAFWDPIVGQCSDRTRTRLGRRHPYIYAAAVPASLAFAAIFMPPLGWSDDALFAYLLVVVVASRMFDSLIEIPGSALLPELSSDYDERTSLGSWRFFFLSVVGRPLATTLAFGVFLKATRHQRFGQLNIAGYEPYALTVAAIAVVAVVGSALATQRFVPFMHRPRKTPGFAAMARAFAAAVSNRNFVALALSSFIFGIAVGIGGGLQTYFYTYFWELPSPALFQLGLWLIPGTLIGVFAAPYLARTLGKKPACLIVFFGGIFATTVPIGLRLLGVLPPNSSPWVLRILILDQMTIGLLSTTGFVIVTSMLADVVEAVQVRTGERSEGVLFAADSLLRKVTQSFAVALPGLLLNVVRFPRHAQPGHVDQGVLIHLAQIYLPLVTVLYLCSTSVLMLYRIDRRSHEADLAKIAEAALLSESTDPELTTHTDPEIVAGAV
jgi:glycoside/pentoside/hexuronide:cation symporter, GPH family